MPAHRIIVVFCLVLSCVAQGCDEEEGPPPRVKQPPRRIRPVCPPDLTKAAIIHADSVFSIPNLIFVLRSDPIAKGRMGVTLKSSEPGSDGSRLVFGSREPEQTLSELAKTTIDMTTSPVLDAKGNGIFTKMAAYQPKFASLKIKSFAEDVIQGSLTGEFYRFDLQLGGTNPDIIEVELQFTARLLMDPEFDEGG